jgi:L-amino acid N-acyltransferase YncA
MSTTPDRNLSVETCGRAPVTIRPATIKDIHEIALIWMEGQVAHGYEPPDLSHVLDIFRPRLSLQTDVDRIWVAEIEGAIVGWQSLHPCRANPLWKWAESSTYISAQSRGLGVGRKLLVFVTEYAKSVDLSHVVGVIIKGNEAPIRIVESLGWQKVGIIPRSKPSGTEWLYYVYAVPH